jgi:predicted HTH transcriptional regulator
MTDVASGEVREHHHLEFKRDNYGSADSSKKELAKDVAALAVDGGVLVIGVDEDSSSGRATQLTPVALAGQVERIQSICAGRIDPPLPIKVRDLPDPDIPETGLVVIEVPSSPTAPHQVDGRYVGRADRMVRVLADAEVVRLHHLRVPLDRAVEDELQRARNLGGDRWSFAEPHQFLP